MMRLVGRRVYLIAPFDAEQEAATWLIRRGAASIIIPRALPDTLSAEEAEHIYWMRVSDVCFADAVVRTVDAPHAPVEIRVASALGLPILTVARDRYGRGFEPIGED
ncbi:hypothetical protein TH66_13020 [Carbonactinospora thermoautotrophica]|uniref:Uncharacterized protein n=2 Tax=Carbonactinospora thermoautotrophica TaxID=1469144 RepID=A0A132NDK8_9ACTN|nr:hypothetical protein [Carbonactinospora thermoautotrophica]KWX03714.1 hypothetical protein TH66_13020 [Carbonactinospora thermoautotrophica]KWX08184.1 hypothetical protein TR74_16145 [Carbonactinospora thermoautotrophica]